jgi:uncharacterized protein YjgD (DUF1641 family)
MQSLVDFVKDIEPLLKSAVPQMIHTLDEMERKGVFRIIKATMGVRTKIAETYSAEDIEQIGDGMVAMLGIAKKMSDPKAVAFLEKAAAIPGSIDLSASKKMGPFGMMSAIYNDEIKVGLGVLMELTKALGKLKDNGDGNLKEVQGAKPA